METIREEASLTPSPHFFNPQFLEHGFESTENIADLRSSEKLFACPYAKRTGQNLSCSRVGWRSIHRLRQHIYHCHVLPIKCPSCSQSIESGRMLADHRHAVPAVSHCEFGVGEPDEPMKGLESLLAKIQTTKTLKREPSEEDMWKALYLTVFPNDPRSTIPSPYHIRQQAILSPDSSDNSGSSIRGESISSSRCTPEPRNYVNSPRVSHEVFDRASSASPAFSTRSDYNRPWPLRRATDVSRLCDSPLPIDPFQDPPQSDAASEDQITAAPITLPLRAAVRTVSSFDEYDTDFDEKEPSNMRHDSQTLRALEAQEPVSSTKSSKIKKKLNRMSLGTQVGKFKAWQKPHRTDEHITPGVYHRFWKWFARCLTCYIPTWFLAKFYKMHDLRERLAFRQKVLFCMLLAAIYAVLCYFMVVQPVASCIVKVHIGMIPKDSPFCDAVRDIIYVYMGLGGVFMLLVAFCVGLVRYTGRKFEEQDKLLVMHIPCYNESEAVLRKTIESCVESTYDKKRKLLYIVADGTVPSASGKPTYKVLLENIFDHSADVEMGIDNQARTYTSFDANGVSDNQALCCTGHFRGVPYVLVVKTGREDERDAPKPGNRGKRDSQLLVYNFFHYVNYRRFWSPLFEDIEFKMRVMLNMDARDAEYMLVVDCDTELEATGISLLVHQLEKDPKLLGACGYTGVGNPLDSFVACAQVFEYWLTHAVLKAVESTVSNVLVLSGCFTIYRLKWKNDQPAILHPLLLEDYAGNYDKTLHEHNLLSIGEDRYLSTLAIRYFGSDCRLRYFAAAKCTTIVPDTLSVLLDQRRRWTNSLIHCHFAHLNVLPFEASFWTQVRLLFVIGAELFMVFILPLALPAGLVLAIISVLLTPYAYAILIAFLLLPVLLCALCNDWVYIPFYVPFFPMIAYFSIIIPLYSAWKQDNIKWGKTRGG